jgi:hypothetical protein
MRVQAQEKLDEAARTGRETLNKDLARIAVIAERAGMDGVTIEVFPPPPSSPVPLNLSSPAIYRFINHTPEATNFVRAPSSILVLELDGIFSGASVGLLWDGAGGGSVS